MSLAPGEYLVFNAKKVIHPEEGTIMLWIRPHWDYYQTEANRLVSHSFVSFEWNDNRKGYFLLTDGTWEPAGSPYSYFVFNNQDYAHTSVKVLYHRGEWIHLACSWKVGAQGYVRFYLNGMLVAAKAVKNLRAFEPMGPMYLGCDRGVPGLGKRWADSDIDEFATFPYAMTEKQLHSICEHQYPNWEKHRYDWLQPILAQPYEPIKNSRGTILETRAIFDEGTGWMTEKGARETISRIKAAGFNVYIPCIWHGRGTRYPCSLAPPEEKLDLSGDDPLARLIRIAHAGNIEVHPWFCVALRQRDFLDDYFDPGTPPMAFDLHKPGFRQFIKDLIVDTVKRYDIDGIQLDYIRTTGICTSVSCKGDYRIHYGRSLMDDLAKHNAAGGLEPHVQEWQDNAVEAVVRAVAGEAKALKPRLVLSVYGHPQLPDIGLPVNQEGRREVMWARKGLINLIFCGEYGDQPDFQNVALISKEIPPRVSALITLGNYGNLFGRSGKSIIPRDAKLVADFIACGQRINKRGVALYLYSQLNDEQISALRHGPFSLPARPHWYRQDLESPGR